MTSPEKLYRVEASGNLVMIAPLQVIAHVLYWTAEQKETIQGLLRDNSNPVRYANKHGHLPGGLLTVRPESAS